VDGRLIDATPSATALWSTAREHLVTLFASVDDVEVLLREKNLARADWRTDSRFQHVLV